MSLIVSQPTSSEPSTRFDGLFQPYKGEARDIIDNANCVRWGLAQPPNKQPRCLYVAKECLKVRKLYPYNIYQDQVLIEGIIGYLSEQKNDCTDFNITEIYEIIQACIKLIKYTQYDERPQNSLQLHQLLDSKVKDSSEYKLFKQMAPNIKLFLQAQSDENSLIDSMLPKDIVELIKKLWIDIITNAAHTQIDISLPPPHFILSGMTSQKVAKLSA